MTNEETIEYDRLKEEDKRTYDRIKNEKPQWSHKQIMSKLAIERQVNDMLEKGSESVDPNDPVWWEEILKGALGWLKNIGCFIESVCNAFNNALKSIGGFVGNGLKAIVDFIDLIF